MQQKTVIFVIASLFLIKTCASKKYIIKQQGWNNEIKKCVSGGEDYHLYHYTIGSLNALGLDYNSIDNEAAVTAYGTIYGHTGATDRTESYLLLKEYKDTGSMKSFHGKFGFESIAGWAKQRTYTELTTKFSKDGDVLLDIYVYAAAWMSVTCAVAKANINSIEVVIATGKDSSYNSNRI